MNEPKTCRICKRTLPASSFSRNKRIKDGRSTSCKECGAKRRRDRKEKLARTRVVPKEQLCNICGRMLPASKFSRSTELLSGLRHECRECEHNRSVTEKRRAQRKKWHRENKIPKRNARKNLLQSKIRHAVDAALKNGTLVKPHVCEVNNEKCYGKIEAHHFDYSRPLDVVWLCKHHHGQLHVSPEFAPEAVEIERQRKDAALEGGIYDTPM